MQCVSENIACADSYLHLSGEPGWGVAFYLANGKVRVYEQSLYLLSLMNSMLPVKVMHDGDNKVMYSDLEPSLLIKLLDDSQNAYFDSGYGLRWLSDAFFSNFAFERWKGSRAKAC